jgi:carbonic anhydrase
MRLFESIIDANHRAVAGDDSAGLHPADFADALPVIALTCIDPRLNAFFPNALALPAEDFIWLRNAGNIITGTLSSTMRSLALACAVKGGREIAIIGHTDCQVCKTTTSVLLDKLKALGVERNRLPENINEFFGMFATERQNVIKACDFARSSPLLGPKIPVHGLLIDVGTGKLDWVVNGYDTLQTPMQPQMLKTDFATIGAAGSFKDFEMGEMKFPESKIGDAAARTELSEIKPPVATPPQIQTSPIAPARPPKIPLPPPIRPRMNVPFGRR